MQNQILQKIGGRKVVFGLVLVAVGTIVDLAKTGGMSENLMQFLIAMGGGFFLGNGLEHGAAALKKRKGSSSEGGSAPAVDLIGVETKLAEVSTTLNTVAQAVGHLLASLNRSAPQSPMNAASPAKSAQSFTY